MKGEKRVKYHRELNVVTFVLALFECLCFAGIIFGWFSIRPVLEQEGFFGAQTHEKAISISKMMDKMGSGEKNANETINGPNEVPDPIATQNDTSENADPNKTSECILGSSSNSSSNMADSNAQFNLVFTVSSSALNYSSLLTGFLLDKFGTLVSKLLARYTINYFKK
ncbi:uncharacterized protein LOC134848677 [Symsagittifera roscoffensis]|uniref:uncharacterized protein LOC134848677 n=1 Tax=Symsagittifera roscoffensis TaxID=84072 RepID=UPI00307B1FA6